MRNAVSSALRAERTRVNSNLARARSGPSVRPSCAGVCNRSRSSLAVTIRGAKSCCLTLACPPQFWGRCYVSHCRDWLRFVGLTPSFLTCCFRASVAPHRPGIKGRKRARMLLQKGLAIPCHWSITELRVAPFGPRPGYLASLSRGLGSAAIPAALFQRRAR